MQFPEYRPRRLRRTESLRRMIRETVLTPDDLILPLFAIGGKDIRNPIPSMPGHFQLSVDRLGAAVREAWSCGIPAVILFGLPDTKDPLGTRAYAKDGIVQKAIKAAKDAVPEMTIITDVCLCQYTDHGHCGMLDGHAAVDVVDVCLCQYTDHGHCGMLDGHEVDNDATLDLLTRTALSHAKAGADMVAPSDMMDGRVAEIRDGLDDAGFSHIPIMAYAAKYCSSYYGPFREAADSAPQFGDRRSYQMDPSNALEAVREATLDVEEGADIIMVKPALAYLDIIYRVREELDLPVAAYSVSGEYAMIKAAEEKGWLDGPRVMMETLTAMKRSGADMILTYFAVDAARLIAG